MIDSTLYEDIVRKWSEVDHENLFNFTSGHLGAIPLSDQKISRLLIDRGLLIQLLILGIFVFEMVRFVFHFIFPINNMIRFSRAALRKLYNANMIVNQFTILSLGAQAKNNDAYFSPLLAALNYPINYIKIVGGRKIKSNGYFFIESGLSQQDLVKLFVSALLLPLSSLVYLLSTARNIQKYRHKAVYVLLGMKNINTGIVYSNKVITHSLGTIVGKLEEPKLLYPMEGRNWEKVLVSEINIKNGEAIGYLHAALTPRQLNLTTHSFYQRQEIPSAIITPSIFALKLIQQTFPHVRIKKGFFLRGSVRENKLNKIDKKLLLFALTGNLHESTQIMEAIANMKGLDEWNVVIRLNPNTSTYQKLANLASELNLKLFSIIDDVIPKICFFRSSSVAIDYLKLGVTPVFLRLNEIITNNIFELDNECQFASIKVDENFNRGVRSIIETASHSSAIKGYKASQYYLDQSYQEADLKSLVD